MGEGAPLAIYTQSSSISPGRSLGLCGGGRARRERTRAGRDGAAPTSPPPAPPPSAPLHACRRAASMSAMRDRAEADLRASDPRVRTTGTRTRRPDTKCTPANHGRELSARDLNSSLASTTACWPSARKGAALGRDRGRDARPHALALAPLNAPRTQRFGRWVWCVPMQARRPNVMAGMQTGVAPCPATAVGTEGRTPLGRLVAAARRRLRCEGEGRELTTAVHREPRCHARCQAWH